MLGNLRPPFNLFHGLRWTLNTCVRNTEKGDDSSGGNFGQGALWGMIEEASLAPSICLNDGMQVGFSFFLVNRRGINNVTEHGGRCFQGTAMYYGCSVRLVRLVPHQTCV